MTLGEMLADHPKLTPDDFKPLKPLRPIADEEIVFR
jgi:hypothetical protein